MALIPATLSPTNLYEDISMRSILLWFIGIPIPIIILLALFGTQNIYESNQFH